MDGVLLESPLQTNPPNLRYQFGENHETLLRESIDRFLQEFSKGIGDFSGFRSIFFRLLHSRADPPLEIIWFYSAVSFHGSDSSKDDVLNRVLIAKGLFQHLVSCSASLDGLKSIALLAPVLFKLHSSVIEFFSSGEKLAKLGKKLRREIECLVEGILGYVGICSSNVGDKSGGNGGGLSAGLLPSFGDLIHVWVVNRLEEKWEVGEGLRVFFPLVSDEIRNGFWEEGCGIGYLAGVVIVEAFLLRLCLKIRAGAGVSKSELQKELKIWAVGSITGFRNCVFFGMLLRLLLEPALPVTSLLSSEDEAFLREVLYDAVTLVDYSFLSPKMAVEQYDGHMKSLAITRLIAAHEAIRGARTRGDHTKAISYTNAFSGSQLPSELIKWVASQAGMEKSSIPLVSTPQALLKWLLNLEDKGLSVFGNGISKFRNKLVFDDSSENHEHSVFKPSRRIANDDLFVIDKVGQQTEKIMEDDQPIQYMDAAFISAAQTMKFTSKSARRKRKERRGEGEEQFKLQRYKYDSSAKGSPVLSSADDMSSGSEVENPSSDDDAEEMEQ